MWSGPVASISAGDPAVPRINRCPALTVIEPLKVNSPAISKVAGFVAEPPVTVTTP